MPSATYDAATCEQVLGDMIDSIGAIEMLATMAIICTKRAQTAADDNNAEDAAACVKAADILRNCWRTLLIEVPH